MSYEELLDKKLSVLKLQLSVKDFHIPRDFFYTSENENGVIITKDLWAKYKSKIISELDKLGFSISEDAHSRKKFKVVAK